MKLLNKKHKFKIPDNDQVGLGFIKATIPGLTQMKLFKLKGIVEGYPDQTEKTEILEALKKEFKKRGIEWVE